jgi:phosphatidylglycerophosphate synthase
VTSVSVPPSAADFRARSRASGLFTDTINQWIGSYLAVAGQRLRWRPTILTLFNLVIGLGTSIIVALLAPALHRGDVSAPVLGIGALIGWQLAYSFDCADGQLARVTGQTSPAGRRIDVLSDVALQVSLVAAVCTVASEYHSLPVWLAATFAGTWMVNLVTSELQKGDAAHSLVTSTSPVIRLVKLVRDYGAVVTVLALALAVQPAWLFWVLTAFTLVNGLFLVASIVATSRASLRPNGE